MIQIIIYLLKKTINNNTKYPIKKEIERKNVQSWYELITNGQTKSMTK